MPNSDFCLEIKFQRDTEAPSRVFHTMARLIDAFQELDHCFIKSIHSEIKPVLLLENIEVGSIKTFLRLVIENLDDDSLKKGDVKGIVGGFLLKAKYFAMNFLTQTTEATNLARLEQLEGELHQLVEETDIKRIPAYSPVPRKQLLEHLSKITEALSGLTESDQATFISQDGEIPLSFQFPLTPENIEQLVTREVLQSHSEMILKVRKPDFLGESRWEFRHGGKPFLAKIADKSWLQAYQDGAIDIRPGDAIRVLLETSVKYDFDGEPFDTQHTIITVVGILPKLEFRQHKVRIKSCVHK